MSRNERLSTFITWWREHITGDEKGEAQIFLDRLLQACGHRGALEVGRYEERVPRKKRNGKAAVSFADYVMRDTVLIEMKKRGENLAQHYDQLEDYWKGLAVKPRYAVLCNFDEIWIYSFPTQFYEPVDFVKIEQLVDRADALEFLFADSFKTPVFRNNLVEVTKDAAFSLSKVFASLENRKVDAQQAQHYVLQCMLALFAEDIQLLPSAIFTRVIERCLKDEGSEFSPNNYDLIKQLFTTMNTPGIEQYGMFYQVDYFNGGIFREINPVPLSHSELLDLREAARQNWSKIKPAIFGTIFESSMLETERHKIGAHFTSEQDIKLIVDPVIVQPWDARIEAAHVSDLKLLHAELCNYKVLDPACGSGNFLYIAYIEMKKLEKRLFDRLREVGAELPEQRVSVKQFYGIDIKPFAVELAKVTLMIAKKIAVDEVGSDENPLPLDNMDANIICADALFTPWPEFDACIGNPPYLGAKNLKQEHPPQYINQIREAFPSVPGNADYCVYWFRKAHDLMKPGSRAGLVGTNTIRQNYSRVGGLDYIVDNGGFIYDAITSKPWSGEAKVHVSIVSWSKGKPPVETAKLRYFIGLENGDKDHIKWREVLMPTINSSLAAEVDVSDAKVLSVNTRPKRVFQGVTPGHKGFVITKVEAAKMINDDAKNREVVFPYLTGDDMVGKPGGLPSRFIIDFETRELIDAKKYKSPFKRVETTVKLDKEKKAEVEKQRNVEILAADEDGRINQHHQKSVSQWWLHFYGRADRAAAMADKKRYIACSRVTKRNIFEFVSSEIKPGDSLQTFAFDDNYSYGILHSDAHWKWLVAKGSSLKGDIRYTPTSVFDTFPWAQNPSDKQVKAVADAVLAMQEFRYKRTKNGSGMTLRDMYQTLELPGKNQLRDLHQAIDKAVMAAYGFDLNEDVLAQLLALNLSVAAKIAAGEPVTAPGIPPSYPNPAELVSEGCIQPPELI